MTNNHKDKRPEEIGKLFVTWEKGVRVIPISMLFLIFVSGREVTQVVGDSSYCSSIH